MSVRHRVMFDGKTRAVLAPLSRGVDSDTATERRDYSKTAFLR